MWVQLPPGAHPLYLEVFYFVMQSQKRKLADILTRKFGFKDLVVDVPEDYRFGDYSININKIKNLSKDAGSIIKFLDDLRKEKEISSVFERVETVSGYINFYVKEEILFENLKKLALEDNLDIVSHVGKGKTVVIDYSSPNIAKRFSIGHLRSTIIGQALYNIYKSLGYRVIGDNHIGDWGTQFGKLLYMIDREKVSEFDIDKLEELYVRFHDEAKESPELEDEARAWFKRLEEGEERARETWKRCVEVSISEFDRIYKRLGVSIDFSYGESFYEDRMRDLIKRFEDGELKGLSDGIDGAKIIDLSDFGIKVPLMFLKSDGTTTYAARDLATIDFRVKKWNPDIIIYEVGAEQSLHFQQVFAAARKIGIVRDDVVLYHTGHGLYLSEDGTKFRTRSGGTIKLEEVLDKAVAKAKKIIKESSTSRGFSQEEIDKLSEKVGIGAVKYFDLKHSPQSNIIFDWDKVVNLEGNSGPYIQYTYARARSVIDKAGYNLRDVDLEITSLDDMEEKLLRKVFHFSEIIEDAGIRYSPNIVCSYLYSLARDFNYFYASKRILGDKKELFRVVLTRAVKVTIEAGLWNLGISSPDRM